MKRFRYCIDSIYSLFSTESSDRVFMGMIDSNSDWLLMSQACEQCLIQYAQFQVAEAQNDDTSIRISQWKDFQSVIQTEFLDQVMPAIDRDPQVRSLVPEVVRLMKLLQIDWQFWQAARQPEKRSARRQQFFHHWTQLGQLLSALQNQLEHRADLKECPD